MNQPDQPMPTQPGTPAQLSGTVLDALGDAIGKLRFGMVQLTIHEGRVVQLEVTEKHRF